METQSTSTDENPEPMVRAKRVAPIAGVCEKTILNMFHAGVLPGYRLGKSILFRISEVVEAIESQQKK